MYTKNKDFIQDSFNYLPFDDSRLNDYKNPDNDPRKEWASRDITGQSGHATASQFYTITTPSGISYTPPDGRCWAISEGTFKSLVADNRIWFGKNGDSRPRLKLFLSESKGKTSWTWWDNKEVGHSQEATKELNEINLADLSGNINPKPTRLLKRIIQLASHSRTNDLILDFFAGSATTAQAVMELNAEDGGNRSFVLVQLPEPIDKKFEAYKTGYRTIADISRERIRRVIQKMDDQIEGLAQTIKSIQETIAVKVVEIAELKAGMNAEIFDGTNPPKAVQRLVDEVEKLKDKLTDTRTQHDRLRQTAKNFRAYRLAPSNFNVWQSQETSKQAIEQLLLNFTQSDKPGADTERMLTEFMLKTGHPLNTSVEVLDLAGVPAYSVADGRLLVLLDGYNEAINTLIWETHPKQVVCLDRLFAGRDELLANLHLELRDRGIDLTVI